ncbi:MAG: M20/M25/M40 family metallo-hydrolase [Mycoplasma sp.]|nr:M20/M25/M40 family metallo-hydrolase [Candidatus Hennigella equi]
MSRKFDFETLEPRGVLSWFKKICAIPHGSYNEAALADMLKHELNKAGCYVKQFSSGAILARKKATKGYEKKPTVLLQAHMDMVLTKRADVKIDLNTTPIKPFYDTTDGYIKCDGTTLGADNGIGVAAIMEIMTSNKYNHGPLEALLSVTEEIDIQYCMNSIPKKSFKAKHLLNLDIESPEKMYTSSNGANRVVCERPLVYKPVHKGTKTYLVQISHLDGGHSALAVHNPLSNAITLLCEAMYSFTQDHSKVSLVSIDGGNAFNAIPRKADMVIQADPKDLPELKKHLRHALDVAITMAQGLDKEGRITVKLADKQVKQACDYDETEQILWFFAYIPTGIEKMDITMKHIFASHNVGIVKTENNILKVSMMPRCFFSDGLEYQFNKLRYFGTKFGFRNFQHLLTCVPWLTEHPDKVEIAQTWSKCFTKVTGRYTFPAKDPGGIEPAAIIDNSPQLLNHAVAVGPRMYDCHSPLERVEVKSIVEWWKTLLLVLKEIK